MFDTIKNAGKAIIKPLQELYTKYTPQAIQDTVGAISSSFGKLFGQVKQFGKNVVDTGVKAVETFDALQKVNAVVETAKTGLNTTKNAFVDLMQGILGLPGRLFNFVTSFFTSTDNAEKLSSNSSKVPTTVTGTKNSGNGSSSLRALAKGNANSAQPDAPVNDRRSRFAAKV